MNSFFLFVSLAFGLIGALNLIPYQRIATIDDSLQNLRWEYRIFKRATFKLIDYSFFSLYNNLNITISEIMEPVNKTYSNWNQVCNEYNKSNLVKKTIEEFDAICFTGKSLIEKLMLEHEKTLTTIYSGELMETTPLDFISRALLDDMEHKMDQIMCIYSKNKSSSYRFLKDFFPSLEPITNNIELVKLHLPKYFTALRIISRKSKQEVYNYIKKIKHCSTSGDQNKCLMILVKLN